jgi:hypothetical protein
MQDWHARGPRLRRKGNAGVKDAQIRGRSVMGRLKIPQIRGCVGGHAFRSRWETIHARELWHTLRIGVVKVTRGSGAAQTLEAFGGQSSIVQESWDVVLGKFSDLEVLLTCLRFSFSVNCRAHKMLEVHKLTVNHYRISTPI